MVSSCLRTLRFAVIENGWEQYEEPCCPSANRYNEWMPNSQLLIGNVCNLESVFAVLCVEFRVDR